MALLPLALLALGAAGWEGQDADGLDAVSLMPRFLLHFVRRFLTLGNVARGRFVIVSMPTSGAARLASSAWSDSSRQQVLLTLQQDGYLPVVLFGHGPPLATASSRIRTRLAPGGIVLLGTISQVESAIQNFSKCPEWGSRGRILVLLDVGVQDDVEDSVLRMLSVFWSLFVPDVVVAVLRADANDTLSLYRMAPFSDNSGLCGQGRLDVTFLGAVPLRTVPDGLAGLVPYRDMVPADLRGCTVRGSVYKGASYARCADGDDVVEDREPADTRVLRGMLEAAARRYNFRADVTVDGITTGATELVGGKFTGRLGLLERGETDVALAPFTYTRVRLRRLRPSVPFLMDPAQVRVRCSPLDRIAHSGLFNILVNSGLLPLVAGLTASAVACQLLIRCLAPTTRPQLHNAHSMHVLTQSVLDVWAMLCEVATPLTTPFAARLPARLLIASWLLVVLNLNVAIKGLLSAASTVTVLPVRRITSIEQLRASDVVLGYPTITYREVVLGELQVPEERTLVCTNDNATDYCEAKFNADVNFAVVRPNKMPVGMKCLTSCHYTLDAVVKTTPLVFYMRKDYVLAAILDRTVLSLQSAGIIEYWLSGDFHWIRNRRSKDSPSHNKRHFLDEAFLCLGLGLSVSLAVFVLELSCHRHWRRGHV